MKEIFNSILKNPLKICFEVLILIFFFDRSFEKM
jgi:hypothetical protein